MDVASFGFKTAKFQADPTASGVPLLAANPEQGFFKDLDKYRFDDGTRIDFRGDADLSVNGREGTSGQLERTRQQGICYNFRLAPNPRSSRKIQAGLDICESYLKDDPGALTPIALRQPLHAP